MALKRWRISNWFYAVHVCLYSSTCALEDLISGWLRPQDPSTSAIEVSPQKSSRTNVVFFTQLTKVHLPRLKSMFSISDLGIVMIAWLKYKIGWMLITNYTRLPSKGTWWDVMDSWRFQSKTRLHWLKNFLTGIKSFNLWSSRMDLESKAILKVVFVENLQATDFLL